jgi:large subunit ribosomal protein L24
MSTRSIQPRRQRKALYEAHSAERHKRMSVALSRELRTRFGRRQVPLRKGDTVRILSGSYKGREERVAKVIRRDYTVTLDNVTGKAGDQKLKPQPIRLAHLLIVRLNLSDPWRRRVLKVADTDLTEADLALPTQPSTASPVAPAATAGPTKGSA